jgi:integrase
MLAFFGWAEGYHRKNGKLTSEVPHIRYSIKPVRELYGDTPARAFGPLQFKTVRQSIIKTEICRNEVNRRIRIIVRGFKWAVSEGMIPASVHHGLQTVTGLRRGRSEVRESEPVRPVPDAFVDAIRPHVSRQIWAMVQIQRLTGMRPGEICSLRTVDIDRSSKVWIFDTPR